MVWGQRKKQEKLIHQMDEAISAYQRGELDLIEVSHALMGEDASVSVAALDTLASQYLAAERWVDAGSALSFAAAIYRALGRKTDHAAAQHRLGRTYERAGRTAEAATAYQDSATIYEQLGMEKQRALVLQDLVIMNRTTNRS